MRQAAETTPKPTHAQTKTIIHRLMRLSRGVKGGTDTLAGILRVWIAPVNIIAVFYTILDCSGVAALVLLKTVARALIANDFKSRQ